MKLKKSNTTSINIKIFLQEHVTNICLYMTIVKLLILVKVHQVMSLIFFKVNFGGEKNEHIKLAP